MKFVEKSKKKDIILKKHQPVRMCIVCKNRFEKRLLNRFSMDANKLCVNVKLGRGIYLCQTCALKEEKILYKAFSKMCKKLKIIPQNLKELF
ncbi:putative nucleic-acid-binding protein (DUF448 domain) [Campylobacter cuniculorum DSM 23162 = LMG 24588]|nr:putative nucleic-acid-binding protein (DUF448 domain) [Campylobacter cuniculorum DSM 23162 = LMG 24588]